LTTHGATRLRRAARASAAPWAIGRVSDNGETLTHLVSQNFPVVQISPAGPLSVAAVSLLA